MAGDYPLALTPLSGGIRLSDLESLNLGHIAAADNFLQTIKSYGSIDFGKAANELLEFNAIAISDESDPFIVTPLDEGLMASKTTQKLIKAHNNKTMSDISREELDAKLQVIEARMDTRVAEVVGRIDAMIASQQGLVDAMRAGQEGLDKLYQAKFDSIDESQKATEAGIRNLKSTFIVTAISSAIAIVLGIAAFNATVLSNMVASFESGKNTMQSINQVSNQLNDTAKRLDELDKRIGKSGKSN